MPCLKTRMLIPHMQAVAIKQASAIKRLLALIGTVVWFVSVRMPLRSIHNIDVVAEPAIIRVPHSLAIRLGWLLIAGCYWKLNSFACGAFGGVGVYQVTLGSFATSR